MKKIVILISLTFLLSGCAESIALLGGTAGSTSSGRMIQSSVNTVVSYGIKKQTGKTPIGHALAYAEEKNPQKKKRTLHIFYSRNKFRNLRYCKKTNKIDENKVRKQKKTW